MPRLSSAIEQTPDVRGHSKVGKSAIKKQYRSKVVVPDTRLLTCSLDIDSAVCALYPDANRWDYAVEYNDQVFFLEVHPVETSEIKTVLAKLAWLETWLKTKATEIDKLKATDYNPYYWIASGSYNILRTSSQYRNLATSHLLPQTEWNFNKIQKV